MKSFSTKKEEKSHLSVLTSVNEWKTFCRNELNEVKVMLNKAEGTELESLSLVIEELC